MAVGAQQRVGLNLPVSGCVAAWAVSASALGLWRGTPQICPQEPSKGHLYLKVAKRALIGVVRHTVSTVRRCACKCTCGCATTGMGAVALSVTGLVAWL